MYIATATLITILLAFSAAPSSASIPSRKVGAPTHAGYDAPASAPLASATPTRKLPIPSRNVLPPTAAKSSLRPAPQDNSSIKAAPESIQPKIMSPPVVPLPQETVQQDVTEEAYQIQSISRNVPKLVSETLLETPVETVKTFEEPPTDEQPSSQSSLPQVLETTAVDSNIFLIEEAIVHEVVDESTTEISATYEQEIYAEDSSDTISSTDGSDESKALEVVDVKDVESTTNYAELVPLADALNDFDVRQSQDADYNSAVPVTPLDRSRPQLQALVTTTVEEPAAFPSPASVVASFSTNQEPPTCGTDSTTSRKNNCHDDSSDGNVLGMKVSSFTDKNPDAAAYDEILVAVKRV